MIKKTWEENTIFDRVAFISIELRVIIVIGGYHVFHLFGDYHFNPDLCTNESEKHV